MRNEHVVIIGTGFGGLGMAIRMKQAGMHDFTILERASGVGGTWRDNHYPGAACDVESHLYSFSFEPNPSWTRTYAPQREILAYLERCADKYGLRRHIRLDTAATGATFDEDTGLWTVETSRGEPIVARVVISATGGLSRPAYPDIPGLRSFAGKTFHSAQWDDAYPFEGKRVGVIGTGASGIQIVPAIAPRVSALEVFQRTPPWILPKPDHDILPADRERMRRLPVLQRLARLRQYLVHELMALGFIVDPRILKLASRLAIRHLAARVPDPELRARLTPAYTMGCKRVLFSNDYYPALTRDNVALVTEGIAEIRADAVVTKDGRAHPLDALILATGFQAAESVAPFGVYGRGGRELAGAWRDGAEAYLGTTVSGFPNFFFIVGPNTGLGHSSMIYMIESQIAYVRGALQAIEGRGLRHVDVRPDAQANYNRRLHARLARTVWSTGCDSWYTTASGKNTTLWPGFTFEFRLWTRRFDAEAYDVVR